MHDFVKMEEGEFVQGHWEGTALGYPFSSTNKNADWCRPADNQETFMPVGIKYKPHPWIPMVTEYLQYIETVVLIEAIGNTIEGETFGLL